MKVVITSLLSILLLNSSGQESVDLTDLKNNVGKVVEVKGKVARISPVEQGKVRYIIMDVGGAPPNQQLSVLLKNDAKGESHYLLKEKKFSSGVIIVIGKVEMYKGKPRIVLKNDENLRFIIDEEVIE